MLYLSMVKVALYSLLIICLSPLAVLAGGHSQQESQISVDSILARSQQHLGKGEACFSSGDMECARREFDLAVDYILESGIDVRSDERLLKGWREVIEKINQYQVSALNDTARYGWRMQEYEGRPAEENVELIEIEDEEVTGPLTPALFQKKFAQLRNSFREKYKRDIILTGGDHGEHRRLYGKGSAFDLRVRDLSREQIKFIISTGISLGLRIKDFSTWEKVAAHNARVYELGRPLDTLATGLHLHVDRMALPKKKGMKEKTASLSKRRSKSDAN